MSHSVFESSVVKKTCATAWRALALGWIVTVLPLAVSASEAAQTPVAPGAADAAPAATPVDPAFLATGQALARSRNCLACHQVDKRRVGPPLRDVAVRYTQPDSDPDAMTAYLATTIRQGGRGKWGAIPMPAQPHVSEAEAATLARWILLLKP